MRKFFFTYQGAMDHTKLHRLIGNPYHTEYASWLGYFSVKGVGDDVADYWRRVLCRHQWHKTGGMYPVHQMAGHTMNTCLKCGKFSPGP
jgi:hypothetical protein